MTFVYPKISVLITTYNAERFIEKTLESVLKQSVKPHEILVMDDGSSDSTVAILHRFEPDVTVFTQRNKGVSAARNALLKKARGDLVGFLDHDDYWGWNYLKQQLESCRLHKEASCYVMGFENSTGNEEMRENRLRQETGNLQSPSSQDFIREYTENTGMFLPSFTLFNREKLQAISSEVFPVNCSGADDIFIFLVMPLLGAVVINDAKVGFFRVSDTSQSHDRLSSYVLRNIATDEALAFYRGRQVEKNIIALVLHFKATSIRGLAGMYFGEDQFPTGRKLLWRSFWETFEVKTLLQLILSFTGKYWVRSKSRFRAL